MVFLDFAATYPVKPQVLEYLQQHLQALYNPSSTHHLGRKARVLKEQARQKLASAIGVNSSQLVFTSGATEANSIAIHTAVHELGVERIVTSPIEHPAVSDCIQSFAHQVEVRELPLDERFQLDLSDIEAYSKDGVKTLFSIIHTNNEVGLQFPIQQIAQIVKSYSHVWFHSDTVQTIGSEPFCVPEGLDYCTISGHKFGAFHGVGAIVNASNTPLYGLQYGGHQERGMRVGTEPLEGILSMYAAWDDHLEVENQKRAGIKQYAIEQLKLYLADQVTFNIRSDNGCVSSSKIINIGLTTQLEAEDIQFQLDRQQIAVSIGSACSSGHETQSKVLVKLLGDRLKPSIRVSLSSRTTKEEIDTFVAALVQLIH